MGRRLVTCLLNVSEARRKDSVERVAKAALYDSQGKCGTQAPVPARTPIIGWTCLLIQDVEKKKKSQGLLPQIEEEVGHFGLKQPS